MDADGIEIETMDDYVYDREEGSNIITTIVNTAWQYGWWLFAGALLSVYAYHKLIPYYERWQQAREDAAYHKNPDVALKRMEAIQRAREKQQEQLAAASRVAAQKQKEREQQKREEVLRLLEQSGGVGGASGSRLGARGDGGEYLPLSGGAGASGYRPPKKKCPGGGCGK